MNRPRHPSPDPSRRAPSYQQGIAPNAQSTPVVEAPEFDYDPNSKSNLMARRAATIVRERYGIEAGDVARLSKYDRITHKVWQQLMNGTYQPPASYIEPKEDLRADPMNPLTWGEQLYRQR